MSFSSGQWFCFQFQSKSFQPNTGIRSYPGSSLTRWGVARLKGSWDLIASTANGDGRVRKINNTHLAQDNWSLYGNTKEVKRRMVENVPQFIPTGCSSTKGVPWCAVPVHVRTLCLLPSLSPASFPQRCRQPGRALCPYSSVFSLEYQSTPSIWSQQNCLQNKTAKHFAKRLAPAANFASTAEMPIVLSLRFKAPILF